MDTLEDINLISDITVSPEEIMDAIKELRPSSASGADGFPAILLTNCYKQLAIPLAILWKVSLQNTTIPDKLKFNIIPLFTKEEASLTQPTIGQLPSHLTSSRFSKKSSATNWPVFSIRIIS